MESKQVWLRLINKDFEYTTEHGDAMRGDQILAQMKKNGVIKNDTEGIYVPVLFDSKAFVFRPGKVVQVGEIVARSLRRSAFIIVGPKAINGPACPFIEIVKEFQIGEQPDPKPQFACPICDKDMRNPASLTRHLMAKHKEEVNAKTTDWEGEGEAVPVTPEEDEL